MATNQNELWTDRELSSAVEGYVFMLRVQMAGLDYSSRSALECLLANDLKARNDASLRYRMRNISSVVSELGGPVLSSYSPAQRVGTNVRARLRKILLAHPGFTQLLSGRTSAHGLPRSNASAQRNEALARLNKLRVQINDLERELLGVGHNRPPETLSTDGPQRSDFDEARHSIEALEIELEKQKPDTAVAKKHTNRLLDFGLKVGVWMGARATKLTDVTLTVVAPILVAHATGFTHELLEAVKAVVIAVSR